VFLAETKVSQSRKLLALLMFLAPGFAVCVLVLAQYLEMDDRHAND
jgi:hypothetical protein